MANLEWHCAGCGKTRALSERLQAWARRELDSGNEPKATCGDFYCPYSEWESMRLREAKNGGGR